MPLAKVAPLRPLGRSLAAIVLLWAVVALLAVCLPGLAWTQWNRFTHPYDDVPPFSLSTFKVTPGNKAVLYGSQLEFASRSAACRSSNWRWSWNGQRPGTAAADVSRAQRRLAGGAGEGGRSDRLLRSRVSSPQRASITSASSRCR